MILGCGMEEILAKAVEGQGDITDGVAAYDYDNGELCSLSYTTGETEHPDNHLIEIYRLEQGQDGEIDCRCYENDDCPFWIKSEDDFCGGHFDEDMIDEYGDTRIKCCINGCVYGDDDFEDYIDKDHIEQIVRDIFKKNLDETIDKLNKIRVEISDIIKPYDYWNVRTDNWKSSVIDSYVDYAIDEGFKLEELSNPIEYLDAEIQHIAMYKDVCEDATIQKVASLVDNGKLDEALEMLQYVEGEL